MLWSLRPPNQELDYDIHSVAEDSFCFVPVGFHCDFLDVPMHIFAHIVTPDKDYHHKKQHLADAVQIREMCVLNVEACAF